MCETVPDATLTEPKSVSLDIEGERSLSAMLLPLPFTSISGPAYTMVGAPLETKPVVELTDQLVIPTGATASEPL